MNIVAQTKSTNQTLIPTFIGELNGETQPLVNARDLHAFLEIGRNVNTWLSTRIEDYQFLENIDFIRFPISESGQNKGLAGFFGGHNKIDYHLSLDMAKELSMVERNDKGREARRYFIACEKAVQQAQPQVGSILQQNHALKTKLLTQNPDYQTIKVMHDGGLENWQIKLALNISTSTLRRRLADMRRLGLIGYQRGITQPQLALEV